MFHPSMILYIFVAFEEQEPIRLAGYVGHIPMVSCIYLMLYIYTLWLFNIARVYITSDRT